MKEIRFVAVKGRPERKKNKSGIIAAQDQALQIKYEGWNFNSGNYLFTIDIK